MEKDKFNVFIKNYLNKFRKYYRSEGTNKKKLKDSVFNSPKLTEDEKKIFWEMITN